MVLVEYDYYHHLPKSKFGSDDESNLSYIKRKFHVNFHRILKNMTPDEQIEFVAKFNQKVFVQEFLSDMFDVLDFHREKGTIYIPGIVKDTSKQLLLEL